MPVCPSCGRENPEGFRFCGFCTAPLPAEEGAGGEVRKTVTVVFADVTGSTALGERLDPESLRRVMSRYFGAMREVLERHAGTVEKFIGDAVMAVFGIPRLHEDDALRAVRAAAEMLDRLKELNAELQRDFGVSLLVRTGVNTGEVVAGDPSAGQTLVIGDAVNTAARLEQAAPPGQILLGETTLRLVRDAVEVEAVEPLALKGKAEPVPAFRLTAVTPGAPAVARHLDSPLVGRERELSLLRWAFDRVVGERTCHLVTVLGSAGVGKSRLVEEFLASVGDATLLRGRCLPYGEGITFWPVVEVVRQAAGIGDGDSAEVALAKVSGLVEAQDDADLVAARVGQVVGLVADSAVPEETLWGIRRLLEAVARRRPLVVLFDDVHWAEPTFLDLIEHLADWSRDAPILVVCLGRQELLDLRPGWGGGKLNATSMLLEPLSEGECGALLENLLGRSDAIDEARARITDAAEGNPLFVEEMLAMLIDDRVLRQADGGWALAGDLAAVTVPPTIQALLAARLDRLDHEERAVIGPASVVGRVFYRGAVAELAPEPLRPRVGAHLMTLVRRELIRPHPAEFRGEDTYRFRHLLIRDAAYDAMPKEARAMLHERFASWLERAAGERLREYEELVGYHLEQAHRYRAELGPLDEAGRAVGERASRFLAAPGRRAMARGDAGGAANLLGRAVGLLRTDDPERVGALTDLGWALQDVGELERAGHVLSEALRAAEATGDRLSALRARIGIIELGLSTDPTRSFADSVTELQQAARLAEEHGDPGLRLEANSALGQLLFWSGRAAAAEEVFERGFELARSSTASGRATIDLFAGLGACMVWGPTTVDEAVAWWTPVLEDPPGGAGELFAHGALSVMHAMAGDQERARALGDRAHAIAQDLGLKLFLAAGHVPAMVDVLVGNLEAAERRLADGVEMLQAMGETGFLSTSAAELADVRFDLGMDEEALAASRLSEQTAAPDDVASQAGWRYARAKVLARGGRAEEAERLAREAVEIIDATDHLTIRSDARRSLGETLLLLGQVNEGRRELEQAIRLYEAKGNVVMAERTRALLREPGAGKEA